MIRSIAESDCVESFLFSPDINTDDNGRIIISRHLSLECSEFSDEGFHEFCGSVTGVSELRFQLVHQGHQLIHLKHDPALFGERWDGNRRLLNHSDVQGRDSNTPPSDTKP